MGKFAGSTLSILGTGVTVYNLGSAGQESYRQNSYKPIASEVIRETGGWAGAVAGAKLGGTIGSALGLPAGGVGSFVTGGVGSLVGGLGGYFGADWIADHIYNDNTRNNRKK